MNYTKNNPGCYHDAIKYCSGITGISSDKEVVVNRLEDLYKLTGRKKKLLYKSYLIEIEDSSGIRKPFMQNNMRFDIADPNFQPVKFIAKTRRILSEFGIEIKKAGKYNDSLGGGWSQKVEMICINGNYFAYMDCACLDF